MSRVPGPGSNIWPSLFPPPRTPGPLGKNDAADPSMTADPGDTPGPLGISGRIRTVAVVAMSGRIKVSRHLKIQLPRTKETVLTHSSNVTGGGRFELHCDGMDKVGKLTTKAPDVKVTFNRAANAYEIVSITIHTLKVIHNPSSRALPVVGKNVTNDKTLRIRSPSDKPDGKGYWRDVIKNMEDYQYGGDPNRNPPNLQWYAAGSSEYHEEVHNQQFRSWMKRNSSSVLHKMRKGVENRLKGVSNDRLTEKMVAKEVQEYFVSSLHSGSAGSHTDEDEAYKKTYRKIWVPVIQKIKDDARAAGWK